MTDPRHIAPPRDYVDHYAPRRLSSQWIFDPANENDAAEKAATGGWIGLVVMMLVAAAIGAMLAIGGVL